ncbi:hypothetical protein EDF68_1281 [Ochrobactrum sp. BH3]|nr:hypothetical protein EDF68_1281 [Ochrobactrum sp. BH3]
MFLRAYVLQPVQAKKDCGPENLKIRTIFGVRTGPIIHSSRQISKAGPEAYEESRPRLQRVSH